MKQNRIVLLVVLVAAVLLFTLYIARPAATIKKIDGIPLWIISSNYSDERREFNGTLKAPGSEVVQEVVQIVRVRLTGLSDISPAASARQVLFFLHCDTTDPIPLDWYLQKERSGPLENQSPLGCGDQYQTILCAGSSEIFITLRLTTGSHQQVRYRLTAQITAAAP